MTGRRGRPPGRSQRAITINALLTWGLYFLADRAIARFDHGSRINEGIVEVALRWLSLVQGLLAERDQLA
jgi:hypothetical protein